VSWLLDTHTLVWWLFDAKKLSRDAEAILNNESDPIFVSAASCYEIAYKTGRGKLLLPPRSFDEFVGAIDEQGLIRLPVSIEHAIEAGRLAGPHRDPWDRILIAQARLERLTMVSVDPVFGAYGIPVTW
jgi:PIN domain nuclease of toxin-antitoxin system